MLGVGIGSGVRAALAKESSDLMLASFAATPEGAGGTTFTEVIVFGGARVEPWLFTLMTVVLSTVLWGMLAVTNFVEVAAACSVEGVFVVVVVGISVPRMLSTSEATAPLGRAAIVFEMLEVEVLLDVEVASADCAPPTVTVTLAAWPCGMTKFGAMLIAGCLEPQSQSFMSAGDGPNGRRPEGALL